MSSSRFGLSADKNKSGQTAAYWLASVYTMIEKEVSEYLRPFNLTVAKFNILMMLRHKDKEGGLSQVEIGRNLIVSASNMTRLLDKLDREGLIERSARKGDRRINLIRITEKGSDILDKVWPAYSEKINEILSLMDKNELKQTSFLLMKWFNKLERSSRIKHSETK